MLIEQDNFPFEFISQLAEKESWRKEIYRPIYHVHKWWAKRLGSIFRGVLLGAVRENAENFEEEFYRPQQLGQISVFDPFMGSGTTVGEAHKLGMTVFGRDINQVAAETVRVALGPLDAERLYEQYDILAATVKKEITAYYQTTDRQGRPATVLYFFWVMTADCEQCAHSIDLFNNYIVAQDAYPQKKPTIHIVCPNCSEIFKGHYKDEDVTCPGCAHCFAIRKGPVSGNNLQCNHCQHPQTLSSLFKKHTHAPIFRLYGKLILTETGEKQYLKANDQDVANYDSARTELRQRVAAGTLRIPSLTLDPGYNTQQAINYNFKAWQDFFNERQLLLLGILHEAILRLQDESSRDALLTLFSSTLEFNNLFVSYKGEGTGAVRHMFAHHILKPERIPIEPNIWGTDKSSGSFSSLFKGKLLRAIQYRAKPTEVRLQPSLSASSKPITGNLAAWPTQESYIPGTVYLSCGDSANTGLPEKSIDLVVTDPPFFDNVHYSELADFFYSWQVLSPRGFVEPGSSTRRTAEVQDGNAVNFSKKLQDVFAECHRVLKEEGLMIFSYHHSREQGWDAVASALQHAGFDVVNAHPVKAEMSGAKPKVQAKSPIQLDIMVICRKLNSQSPRQKPSFEDAYRIAQEKANRLKAAGFTLSTNDEKVIVFGQYLTTDYFLKAIQEAM